MLNFLLKKILNSMLLTFFYRLKGNFFNIKDKNNSEPDCESLSKSNEDYKSIDNEYCATKGVLTNINDDIELSFQHKDNEKNYQLPSKQNLVSDKLQQSERCSSNYSNASQENCDNGDKILLDSEEEGFEFSDDEGSFEDEEFNFKNDKKNKSECKIHPLRKGVIIAIFYIALNLDRSLIHLSHLKRLLKCGSINIKDCTKYLPEDLDIKKIPQFSRFRLSLWNEYSTAQICTIVNSLYNSLDLGLPLVPDLKIIVQDFIKELCLPNDFKDLVESLIFRYPCRYFKVSQQIREFTFIADFETICMAYVVIALKMCFGLDSDYEVRLTEVVDKINEENYYPRSFYLNTYADDSSKRLFSFKDWCSYLRIRKILVCKHNLFMDNYCHSHIANDYVFLEHLQKRKKHAMTLGQEISMEVINKIPLEDKVSVIPKDEFNLINRPMTSATKVILEYLQDPDLRLVLSEDFTQYSIEYVTKYLRLKENDKAENIIKGIILENKVKSLKGPEGMTSFHKTSTDNEAISVFVQFCEDDQYELLKSNKNVSTRENDFDSKMDNINTECDIELSNITFSNDRTIKFVDYPNACIYDDDDKTDLKDVIEKESANQQAGDIHNSFFDQNLTNEVHRNTPEYDLPPNFNRKVIIDELVNIAYQKHNIKPTTKKPEPRKRKNPLSLPKKKKKETTIHYNLLTLYNKYLQEVTYNKNDVSIFSNNLIDSIHNDTDNISIHNENIKSKDISLQNTETNRDSNETKIINNSDVKILENDALVNEELSNASDQSDDYTLPPIISEADILNGESIINLNKAVSKILSYETKECHQPPAKKIKRDTCRKSGTDREKIFCGDSKELKVFPYWVVQFNNMGLRPNHVPFNKNLHESFPHSFSFVLHHCSMVIDSCPFLVYRAMYVIEKLIANDVDKRRNHM